MTEIVVCTEIEAPVERVFDAVDDWRVGQSHIGPLSVATVDGAPTDGLGARYGGRLSLVPGGIVAVTGEFVVIDHYRPERNSLELAGEGLLGWTFGRVGERSLVQLKLQLRLPGGLAGRVAGNGLALWLRGTLDGALESVRRSQEGRPG
jgi:hypothetical protein